MKRGIMFILMFILLVYSVSAAVDFSYDTIDKGTLGYPRWKIFMDTDNSDKLWAVVGDPDHNWYYSTNGGLSWQGGFDVVSGYTLDQHVSLDGDSNDDLFFTYPSSSPSPGHGAIYLNKVSSPGTSSGDVGSPVTVFPVGGNARRSNIQVTNNYVWLFNRMIGTSSENVKYRRYDKNLNPVDPGFNYVHQTGDVDVRIGSTEYQDNPIVVIHYTGESSSGDDKLEYFIWNPDSSIFEQKSNSVIWEFGQFGCVVDSVSNDRTREYSFVVAGDIMHVVWSCNVQTVKHAWLDLSSDSATWNYDNLVSGFTGQDDSWFYTTMLTNHGNDIYAFYSLGGNDNSASSPLGASEIYYNKWDSIDGWNYAQDEKEVYSSIGTDYNINTLMNVNLDSDYIPVIWLHQFSSWQRYVRSERIFVDPITCDFDEVCELGSGETCANCADCEGEQADCDAEEICYDEICEPQFNNCIDGTLIETCSKSAEYGKPWYCSVDAQLIRDCTICGCSSNKPICDTGTGICKIRVKPTLNVHESIRGPRFAPPLDFFEMIKYLFTPIS